VVSIGDGPEVEEDQRDGLESLWFGTSIFVIDSLLKDTHIKTQRRYQISLLSNKHALITKRPKSVKRERIRRITEVCKQCDMHDFVSPIF